MDLVKNVKRMYQGGDNHVHVLAASIRHLDHLLYSFALRVELATVPAKVLEEWAAKGLQLPDQNFTYHAAGADGKPLNPIPYKDLDLSAPWERFNLEHELTTQGIRKFVADYESTIKRIA